MEEDGYSKGEIITESFRISEKKNFFDVIKLFCELYVEKDKFEQKEGDNACFSKEKKVGDTWMSVKGVMEKRGISILYWRNKGE